MMIMRRTTATPTDESFDQLSPTTAVRDITAAGITGGIVIGKVPIQRRYGRSAVAGLGGKASKCF
jgi:hypothetical protein